MKINAPLILTTWPIKYETRLMAAFRVGSFAFGLKQDCGYSEEYLGRAEKKRFRYSFAVTILKPQPNWLMRLGEEWREFRKLQEFDRIVKRAVLNRILSLIAKKSPSWASRAGKWHRQYRPI